MYWRYEDLVYKYTSKWRDLIRKGISHPCFYVASNQCRTRALDALIMIVCCTYEL